MEKIQVKLMKRKEPPYVTKARELRKAENHVQSRLKNGDLYNMKELEKAIFDDDYLAREIQSFRDQQYTERLKYLLTPEGQMFAQQNKLW
ncbi:hypothetical protein OWP16_04585 [Bacillus paranthracis]|uniref:hypothetical protein n=1 Tax=Bacillus paranthracis TaxID=2026186 RepID=UPI00254AA4B0|nr:hypothetical protein [Bacillus paranthracis]MDK7419263.1 hypothetical protein [Bacillus paranthracis]MDK7430872.1 hypothetical protein [Bacillus paranthracis]MDK7516563.1 hypothetical protein [Bacillus paranthracis]MDK7572397.1 hypothetical protein [Bacillus paranthracis]